MDGREEEAEVILTTNPSFSNQFFFSIRLTPVFTYAQASSCQARPCPNRVPFEALAELANHRHQIVQ